MDRGGIVREFGLELRILEAGQVAKSSSESAAVFTEGLEPIGEDFSQQLTAGYSSLGSLEAHFDDVAMVESL